MARAYLDFAAGHPALYEAMFQLPIAARFAAEDNQSELRARFDALVMPSLPSDHDGRLAPGSHGPPREV